MTPKRLVPETKRMKLEHMIEQAIAGSIETEQVFNEKIGFSSRWTLHEDKRTHRSVKVDCFMQGQYFLHWKYFIPECEMCASERRFHFKVVLWIAGDD